MKKILLVDLTNLAYRYIKSKPEYIAEKLMQSVNSFAKSFDVDKIIVSRDADKSKFRKELYPEYKSNRGLHLTDEEREERAKFYAAIEKACNSMKQDEDILVVEEPFIETDDVVFAVTKMFPNNEYVLISGDSDLLQCGVPQFSFRKNAFIDLADEGAQSIEEYVLAKAIAGDTSDNIAGIVGVGLTTAISTLRKYDAKNLEDLLAKLSKVKKLGKREGAILNGEDIISRNLKLIDLNNSIEHVSPYLMQKIEEFIND
jgi:DNA polymerase-1